MCLIDDDDVVAREQRVSKELSNEHAVGDILDASGGGAGFIETNRVTDEGADRGTLLGGNSGSE